ncbi:hypothetical protein [Catenuloplanes indicus]|uniref:Uncharacterized protein n=1 Tax=Catenuloplanes indicus TaxID=137267 RepID=A0AAE3VTH5_9ACTN|nr:hypothetical protein [Catenuloplanes indicus]MDQ0363369.1 hypothetical protein [Catenuloplanes indicus]MDQ0371691.1 hypothetical protein [Catenuloplanes indicus]
MTDTTVRLYSGPELAAESIRRLYEADRVVAQMNNPAGSGVYNRFNGQHVYNREHRNEGPGVYAAHLRESAHTLAVLAQTAAMLGSGITLPAGEQDAWNDALNGVNTLNRPDAERRY